MHIYYTHAWTVLSAEPSAKWTAKTIPTWNPPTCTIEAPANQLRGVNGKHDVMPLQVYGLFYMKPFCKNFHIKKCDALPFVARLLIYYQHFCLVVSEHLKYVLLNANVESCMSIDLIACIEAGWIRLNFWKGLTGNSIDEHVIIESIYAIQFKGVNADTRVYRNTLHKDKCRGKS